MNIPDAFHSARVDFCPSSLPLGVGGLLRLVIVQFHELFYSVFIESVIANATHAPYQIFEPPRNKTNILTYARREGSDQPGHPPSLIGVFAVRSVDS